MANHKILEIIDLKKNFGTKAVHQGISFDLQEGEVLGLFGGSGSGKSVILRSIIGLENPDYGTIQFDGKNVTNFNEDQWVEVRKKIGFVFQNGALFDSLTVEENLAYPLRAHTNFNDSEINFKVNTMLTKVDLKGCNQLYPNELSGGMQKRAGLARATILDPQVILFDEPTAGLDPVNTKRLIKNILEMKEHHMTGIFVSHDIPAAFSISDRIALLVEGKILAIAPPKDIFEIDHPFIHHFFGDFKPMLKHLKLI